MLASPDNLTPKEFGLPDPTQGGNLVFGAYCDKPKLVSILSGGIKPRRGTPEKSSYFPNAVSLSAVGVRGYAETDGISMGWFNIIQNAQRFGSVQPNDAFCYSFVLDPNWIERNIEKFVGIGMGVTDSEYSELFKLGPLKNLAGDISNGHEGAFFEEVHYKGGTLPPEVLRGVLIDEKNDDFVRAKTNIERALKEVGGKASSLSFPIGIYANTGKLIELIG